METVRYIDVTLTPDTSIFASGDVIDAVTPIGSVFLTGDKGGRLESMVIVDEDDQGAAFDVYFAQSINFNLGTENSAPGISDANARSIVGFVAVATGDYKDLGGVRIVCKTGLGIVLAPSGGNTQLYVGVVNGSGTPTYTATGLKLRLGVVEFGDPGP